MSYQRLTLILLVVLALACGCACNKKEDKEPVLPARPVTQTSLGQNSNDFAFQLFTRMDAPGKNLFYSPYSITSALSMCYAGAEGNTAAEMARAMSFNLPEEEQHQAYAALQNQLITLGKAGKAQLDVANALFGSQRNETFLLQGYLDLLRKYYASDLYSLNFDDYQGTADHINRWVEEKTRNRIKNLIKPDHIRDSNDGLVLVNAIYFKGSWHYQFEPKNTHRDKFFTSSTLRSEEVAKPVEMMYQQGKFAYAELPDCQVLELPYSENDLAMLFVLPKEMDELGKTLSMKSFQAWQSSLETSEVKVHIPKFKFDLTLEGLPKYLKDLGMIDAFDMNAADFSGIMDSRGPGLFILDVVHKAFVEVNEEGTEAAAATGVIMATKAAPGPDTTPVFRADKPFLYFILHKPSNTVLFLGKFNEPPQN